LAERVALVTGGGRGVGAAIARTLAADGWDVVVAARTRSELEAVATATGARPVRVDVTDEASVERCVAEAGAVELLVANAGSGNQLAPTWEAPVAEWWRTFEVNVLGVHLCCRAVLPGMLARGGGRIVITGSGAAYRPKAAHTAYPASKAAVVRYAETLNEELAGRVSVFAISPGLVRTRMTEGFPDDGPWVPAELAAELVRRLATGRYDGLAGRFLHAADDLDALLARADEVRERDLQAIRLRR
jgi:NAD(P)-dependent dehydrogenase (short-subunit alcohol dehydrogenase family)